MLTTGDRENDAKKELKRKLRFEIPFKKNIKKFLNKIARENYLLYLNTGSTLDVLKFQEELQSILYDNYIKISNTFSKGLQRQLDIKDPKIEKQTKSELQTKLSNRAIWVSEEILKTTQKKINSLFSKSINKQNDDKERKKEALLAYQTMLSENTNRSETIAATETQDASEDSKQTEALALIVFVGLKKEWNAILDGKTRSDHAQADGQVRNIGQPFLVGGQLLMRPGDTSFGASIGNTINCRCSVIFKLT